MLNNQTPDSLMSNFDSSTRRNIRKASKQGIKVMYRQQCFRISKTNT